MSFYLDGTAFAHKTNSFEQACAPKGSIWRKKSEGFHLGCTSKGCKEGTGGRVLRLMVAISYGKGVIAFEPYDRMCGAYLANFIDTNFHVCLKRLPKQVNAFLSKMETRRRIRL